MAASYEYSVSDVISSVLDLDLCNKFIAELSFEVRDTQQLVTRQDLKSRNVSPMILGHSIGMYWRILLGIGHLKSSGVYKYYKSKIQFLGEKNTYSYERIEEIVDDGSIEEKCKLAVFLTCVYNAYIRRSTTLQVPDYAEGKNKENENLFYILFMIAVNLEDLWGCYFEHNVIENAHLDTEFAVKKSCINSDADGNSFQRFIISHIVNTSLVRIHTRTSLELMHLADIEKSVLYCLASPMEIDNIVWYFSNHNLVKSTPIHAFTIEKDIDKLKRDLELEIRSVNSFIKR